MRRRGAEIVELASVLSSLGELQRRRREELLVEAGRRSLVASGSITRFNPAPGVRYSVELLEDEPDAAPLGRPEALLWEEALP